MLYRCRRQTLKSGALVWGQTYTVNTAAFATTRPRTHASKTLPVASSCLSTKQRWVGGEPWDGGGMHASTLPQVRSVAWHGLAMCQEPWQLADLDINCCNANCRPSWRPWWPTWQDLVLWQIRGTCRALTLLPACCTRRALLVAQSTVHNATMRHQPACVTEVCVAA